LDFLFDCLATRSILALYEVVKDGGRVPKVSLPTVGVEGNYLVIRVPLNLDSIEFAKKHILQRALPMILSWLEYIEEDRCNAAK